MKKFIKVIILAMALIFVFATLASCGRSINSLTKKAEKEGYEVKEVNPARYSGYNTALVAKGAKGQIESAIEIKKEVDGEDLFATVYRFEKASAAKIFAEQNIRKLKKDEVMERSGKSVIIGDKATVEAIW